ncbi:hypothetical protein Tco_1467795, partial [Tanacetum coccineum]
FHMAKQVIPTSQLVPRFHTIGRCNNYAMLQSIPCSPECKIVGKILLDHPLSYALTATADFIYIVDIFRDILHLPVETPENPFVTPVNIETIEAFMNRVGYQGVIEKNERFLHKESSSTMANNDFMNNVRQTKEAIQYPRFIKLILADLMKKFLEIPQRIKEDYHSIKDDIPLVSVYTTGDVRVRGMLILDAFLTKEIHTTNEFKKSTPRAHRTPTLTTSPQGKKRKQNRERERERDAIAEATLLSLALHKTTLAAEAQENVAKVQEKLDKDEIEKMVEGEEYEESYASAFTDSVFNDDVDDFEIEKKKKDEEVEKEKEDEEIEIEKEKYIADNGTGSTEIRKVQKQTPIPSPTRSPRSVSSDKIIREVLDHCNKIVPEMTFAKTNKMIKEEMPRLVKLAVDKDREVSPVEISDIVSKEFSAHGPTMIEELFRKHM